MASSFPGIVIFPARQGSVARRVRTHPVDGAGLDVLLDRWVKQLEWERPGQPVEPAATHPELPGQQASSSAALEGLAIRGSSVTFADAPGECVALDLASRSIAHPGTVGVRGPLVNFRSLANGAGLDEVQTGALEHVAAWFGTPFDAVTTGDEGEHWLRWGLFRFGGESLARCLAAFAERDAAAFQAQLGRYGIGTAPGEAGVLALTAADPATGAMLRDRDAELVIGTEPRLVAVLARAGRHAAAQHAQVETVAVMLGRNLQQLELPGGTKASVALRSKRSLAAMFYIDLVFGSRGATAFVQAAPDDLAAGEAAWLERFAARLERSRRGEHALAVRQIASSPELA